MEIPLKMVKNGFYFILEALSVFKILKRYWKDKVNFKIHDVTTWLTNNCNSHNALYLRK